MNPTSQPTRLVSLGYSPTPDRKTHHEADMQKIAQIGADNPTAFWGRGTAQL
jgi:hypothetical protein